MKQDHPETGLGRWLDEQARQAIPDQTEGWPVIFERLQANLPPLADLPAPTLLPIVELPTQKDRPGKQKGWALAGLGLVAGLALLVVIGSVWLSASTTRPGSATMVAPATGQATSPATNQIVAPTATPTPSVIGRGKLAFVRWGRLMMLDGATNQTTELTQSGTVGHFGWSYDGQWLAYSLSFPNAPSEVDVTRLDGSPAHKWSGFWDFDWSPVENQLSVVPDQGPNAVGAVWLSTPTGSPQMLVGGTEPILALWSSDGQYLAHTIVKNPPPNDDVSLGMINKNGSGAGLFYQAKRGDGLRIIGWWPDGNGLLFQVVPSKSASLAMDGLPVENIKLEPMTNRSKTLLKNLVNPDWLSWSKDGKRLFAVEGGSRELWSAKTLTRCDVTTNNCQPIQLSAGKIPLDPALSPDGKQLAFVMADQLSEAYKPLAPDAQKYTDWNNSRTLWIADENGNNPKLIANAGTGLQSPRWSKDGKRLIYERDGALWLFDLGKNQATRLVDSLYLPDASPIGYYTNNPNKFEWYEP